MSSSMNRRCFNFAAFLFVFCLLAGTARALDLNRLSPAPGEATFVNLRESRTLGKSELGAGIFLGHVMNPLEAVIAGQAEKVSERQFVGVVGVAWGFTPSFQLGLSFPYLFSQSSTLAPADAPDNSGSGDIRIEGKYRFSGGKDRSGFALVPYLSLDTGNANALFSSDARKGGLIMVFDYNWCDHSILALNLGYEFQGKRYYNDPDLRIGNALLFGLGASKLLQNGRTTVGLEVSGRSDNGPFKSSLETPVILDGTVKQAVTEELSVTLGAGTGLTSGYGAPDFRLFLGLRGAF